MYTFQLIQIIAYLSLVLGSSLWASSCIIEKEMNFTHLSHKTSHISPSKTMYIYTFTTITVHIYTIIVAVHIIILLIN